MLSSPSLISLEACRASGWPRAAEGPATSSRRPDRLPTVDAASSSSAVARGNLELSFAPPSPCAELGLERAGCGSPRLVGNDRGSTGDLLNGGRASGGWNADGCLWLPEGSVGVGRSTTGALISSNRGSEAAVGSRFGSTVLVAAACVDWVPFMVARSLGITTSNHEIAVDPSRVPPKPWGEQMILQQNQTPS